MTRSARSGDTHQGCVIYNDINRGHAYWEGKIWEGSDFPPGLGHGVKDGGMREIQSLPNVA